MIICPSITPLSTSGALSQIRRLSKTYDLIEVRTDAIRDLNFELLLKRPRPDLIITNRHTEEMGHFSGTSREQFDILTEAINNGAEYVDVDFQRGKKFIGKILTGSKTAKIICSHHDYRKTPADIRSVYESIKKLKVPIIKIATTALDITDNMVIFKLLAEGRKDRQALIALCMGESGEISRILGGAFGSFLSYAPVSEKKASGPGQIPIDYMKKIYGADKISKRTKIFGLAGNPVKYSRGIYFHNEMFAGAHADAVYVNFLIDGMGKFLESFKGLITGLSVTMPFKRDIVPFLDKIDRIAEHSGAVNTVVKRKGKLHGFNTDFQAILSLLKKRTVLRNKRAVVIGTGSMARSMALAAITLGANVTVIGRSPEKAKILADSLGSEWMTFDKLRGLHPDILMNGTPVGMKGYGIKSVVPKNIISGRSLVFESVYNPVMTPLLRQAAASGAGLITGSELFKTQANLQSRLFLECLT